MPGYYGGGWFDSSMDYIKNGFQTATFFLWLMLIVEIVTLVLVIIMFTKSSHESFRAKRGIYFPEASMIMPDVAQNLTVGDEEVSNPAYDTLSSKWEKTDKDFNGYPVWKMR